MKRIISGMIAALLLIGMSTLAFNIQPARAQLEEIVINPDGSISSPVPANITTSDNVTYAFTGNNYLPIIVNRSNIIIDGRDYTLQTLGKGHGFSLTGISNVTVKNTNIQGFYSGVYSDIYLHSSSNNTISRNEVGNDSIGIDLYKASGNTISGNNITTSWADGIWLWYSSNNNINGNNITANSAYGIELEFSLGNSISGNEITDNEFGIIPIDSSSSSISGNNITANSDTGIYLSSSSKNTITRNNIIANAWDGTYFYNSSSNSMSENNIANNGFDVWDGSSILIDGSSDNIFFHNNLVNNTVQAYNTDNSTNTWDNGYPSGGNYWGSYTGTDEKSGPYQNQMGSDGIGDTPYVIARSRFVVVSNKDNYPLMKPWTPPDIAVVNVAPSKNIIGHGFSLSINTTVRNQGNKIEGVNVTAYANTTEVGKQTIMFTGGSSTTITFKWNTEDFAYGNYTLWVYISLVPGETNTANNIFTYGTVKVTILGDVNGDFHVTILDVVKITSTYGSKRGDSNFNPNCDLDGDGKITILDVVTCTSHYGQKWP